MIIAGLLESEGTSQNLSGITTTLKYLAEAVVPKLEVSRSVLGLARGAQ